MSDEKPPTGKQKQIAISEFFEKNKHFLGFDSLQRSIITAVKESVDNSLDACEEERILPDIRVEINRLKGDRIELMVPRNQADPWPARNRNHGGGHVQPVDHGIEDDCCLKGGRGVLCSQGRPWN